MALTLFPGAEGALEQKSEDIVPRNTHVVRIPVVYIIQSVVSDSETDHLDIGIAAGCMYSGNSSGP